MTWFEEPVSSDDLAGLRLLRDRGPGRMDIAAGEYGYDLFYVRRMLDAGAAVHVLQADATAAAASAGSWRPQCSARLDRCRSPRTPPPRSTCTPAARWPASAISSTSTITSASRACCSRVLPSPVAGQLRPDLSRPSLGLELKHVDAERYAVR